MDRLKTAVALLVALLPVMVVAETEEQPISPLQYFVGVKGGVSKIGNSNRVVQNGGEKLETKSSDFEGFAGMDLGIYTPGGRSRVYYSFEQHRSESKYSNTLDFETIANMHLLSADYLFRQQSSLNPFVGLHFGYASVEPELGSSGQFDESGLVFGLQAGISWTVLDTFGLEFGVRHSLLPSDIKSGTSVENNGNSVTVESQQKGVTSLYAGASYRF
ncbi:outer membrane beta-barrel protein [uncultured Photobacterium sp.]|uniref:outer membrane beta-barrel protein n=1 Tax=uncultured Photobacterium sp. TaxID=173973 RepID=UPI00261B1203|nr:outer membrane beta-barrel protein [uncultured Photobacterium sp.]